MSTKTQRNMALPRSKPYRGGERGDIEFTKRLVAMLYAEDASTPDARAELPLGHAITKRIRVPEGGVGRIIGRGGEVIR